MKFFVTGDTHGNQNFELQKLTYIDDDSSLTSDDILCVLGDFGFIFENNPSAAEKVNLETLSKKRYQLVFIDGNHENFDRLNSLPEEIKWGGKVGVINNNGFEKPIYHLKRGQVFDFNGTKILTIGGAHSIDKIYRTPGISWWKEEDINYAEIEETYKNIRDHKFSVDYVFTHTCPERYVPVIFPYLSKSLIKDTTSSFLGLVEQEVKFKHWYFGHFHKDVSFKDFTCVYDKVIEVPMNVLSTKIKGKKLKI